MCVCSIHMCLVKGPGPPWQPSLLELGAEDNIRMVSERKLKSTATWAIDAKRLLQQTCHGYGSTTRANIWTVRSRPPTQNSGRNNLMVTAHLDCSMLLRVTECLKPRWHFANAPSLYARRMTTAKTVHRRTIAWQHHVQQVGNTVRVQIGDIVQLVILDSSVKILEHVIGVQVHMIHVTLTLAK